MNDIACKINFLDILDSMPGLLPHNPVEKKNLLAFLDNDPFLTIETVLHEMYDLRLPQIVNNWQMNDRICLNCWREILALCGRDWWFNVKKTCQSDSSFKRTVHNSSVSIELCSAGRLLVQ